MEIATYNKAREIMEEVESLSYAVHKLNELLKMLEQSTGAVSLGVGPGRYIDRTDTLYMEFMADGITGGEHVLITSCLVIMRKTAQDRIHALETEFANLQDNQ